MSGKQAQHARRAQQQAERQQRMTQLASPLPEDIDAALWYDPEGQEAIHTVLLDELNRLRERMAAALDAAEQVNLEVHAGKVIVERWDMIEAEANEAHELSYTAWQRALMVHTADEVRGRLFCLITAPVTQDASMCHGEACGHDALPSNVALPWGLCPMCAYTQYATMRAHLLESMRAKTSWSDDAQARRLAKILVTHSTNHIPFCEAMGGLVLTITCRSDPHDRSYTEAVITRVAELLALPEEAVDAIEADWKSLTSRQRAARQRIGAALQTAVHAAAPGVGLRTEELVPAVRSQLGGGDKLLNDTLTLAAGGMNQWRLRAYRMFPLMQNANPDLTRESYLSMSPPLQQLLYVMATFVSSVRM